MNNSQKLQVLLAVIIICAFMMAVSFVFGYRLSERNICESNDRLVPDTTWFTITEKIEVPSPPDTVTLTYVKIVRVPLDDVDVEPGVDSALVALPYEQHYANLDSVAEIWYSGYEAKLDSAILYKRCTTEIITKPTLVEVSKTPILTLDAGIGNHQWQTLDPYVFVRASVNVNHWKIEPYVGYTYSKQPMFGVGISRSFTIIP